MKKEKFKQLFTTLFTALFTALITLASDTYDTAEKRLWQGSPHPSRAFLVCSVQCAVCSDARERNIAKKSVSAKESCVLVHLTRHALFTLLLFR